MKISRDNFMCFEEVDFEQYTFSEQKVKLNFNANMVFFSLRNHSVVTLNHSEIHCLQRS